jgi:acylpyruvate hydrolase
VPDGSTTSLANVAAMRLATLRLDGSTRAVRRDGDDYVLLDAADVGALLAAEEWESSAAAAGGERVPVAGCSYAPLVPRPPKFWCVGQNYAAHVREMGHTAPPSHPALFAKFAIALIGAHDPIVLPSTSDQVDWEVELGVVIGRPGRDLRPSQALGHVAGYTVVNDVSMRDWQRRTSQFLQGKTWERCTPLGPELVTPEELPKGAAGLRLTTTVDGTVMQDSTTADLIVDVAAIVAYVSTIASLEPGDVIATGTPSGVGAGRTPAVFLQRGQTLRSEVEGVGVLENAVR